LLDHIAGFAFEAEPVWGVTEQYFPADSYGYEAVPCF
jgi:hypothetical protein